MNFNLIKSKCLTQNDRHLFPTSTCWHYSVDFSAYKFQCSPSILQISHAKWLLMVQAKQRLNFIVKLLVRIEARFYSIRSDGNVRLLTLERAGWFWPDEQKAPNAGSSSRIFSRLKSRPLWQPCKTIAKKPQPESNFRIWSLKCHFRFFSLPYFLFSLPTKMWSSFPPPTLHRIPGACLRDPHRHAVWVLPIVDAWRKT